ncbi:MAG TPA: hypothetical protein VL727_15570 [Puia sp.]|nr:hypothetical protein [Puia sp.]
MQGPDRPEGGPRSKAEQTFPSAAKGTNVLEQSEENEREKARDEAFSKF